MALPRLFKKDVNIRSVVRTFMVMGKEVRNHSRLKNTPMRLVIDMNPAEPKYWVEMAASETSLIDPEAAAQEAGAAKDPDDENAPPPAWTQYETLSKKKKELPNGLFFGSVETINMKAPQTEGVAYIHFFPQGLMEATALQLTDRQKLTWTLIFNPLTGQADIIEEAKSLKDVTR